MRAVVTLKFPRNPGHNPHNKKTGKCPLSDICTDVTGEHHCYIQMGAGFESIRRAALDKAKEVGAWGITRIEVME